MGDFSRDTFDKVKHYVGVRLQQGVPIVDADWNEQEDIRKYELQAFLKWFIGNGVPRGNDGFRILTAAGANNFAIQGGDGTPEGAGRCLVEGWDILNQDTINYTAQPLYENPNLAATWDDVAKVDALTTPAGDLTTVRTDLVYVDVWEREVNADEDFAHLVNPAIGIETSVRLKREWAVRVLEGKTTLPTPPPDHVFYPLASLKRAGGVATIPAGAITDLRQTGINLSALEAEIADARGIKANLGNRLDESLTKNGRLRHNVVGIEQLKIEELITSTSVSLSASQEKEFFIERIPHVLFGGGSTFKPAKIYLPIVMAPKQPGVSVISEIVYRHASGATDVYLYVANHSNITLEADCIIMALTLTAESPQTSKRLQLHSHQRGPI